MKKTGKIGSILCLLALLGLTGIYALPKVYVLYQANTGKVDICLKEYMLEEGKEVPWKNGKDVLPGGFVSKIPRIRNDGAECYVRATVSFSSQKESEKPLSLENLEGISSDWVRDGDYFYYKHTVKPGEKVELFQGIRIPWEWKTPDEDNVWKACVRAEAVQAEETEKKEAVNILDLLLGSDVGEIKLPTKEVEITRLSQVYGAPFILTIKAITPAKFEEIQDMSIDVKGKDADIDITQLQLFTVIEGVVDATGAPMFKNKELMSKFKVSTPKDLVRAILLSGEIAKIYGEISELAGFGDNAVKEVKNS